MNVSFQKDRIFFSIANLAQKNNAKTVDMHEYNETVRDLCKMTIDRYKSKC